MNTKTNELKELLESYQGQAVLTDYLNDDKIKEALQYADVTIITDVIEDGSALDIDVIYYCTAMEYLAKHDESLEISLEIAHQIGYTLDKLNSELLASLLATENEKEIWSDFVSELEQFFNNL